MEKNGFKVMFHILVENLGIEVKREFSAAKIKASRDFFHFREKKDEALLARRGTSGAKILVAYQAILSRGHEGTLSLGRVEDALAQT